MRIVAHRVRWPIDGRGAARGRTDRESIVVEVIAPDGRAGRGEAAPLPGVSTETLDDVARILASHAIAGDIVDLESALDAAEAFAASPAARFAIETALLDLLGLLDGPPVASAIVVDSPADIPPGATCLKIKVGPGDTPRVRAIAAAAPAARLRLDANRSLPPHAVAAFAAALADLPIDFLEEPCADPPPLALPIALDESLAVDPALARDRIAVLKPSVLGGLRACRAIAATARRAIVTHALEGPIGMRGVLAVARAVAPGETHGTGPHPALAGWPAALSVAAAHASPALAHLRHGPAPTTRAIVAAPDDDATIAAVLAALDTHAPIAVIHAAATPAEQQRQRDLVARADLPAGTAVVLFTSGSTGLARGVVLSRAALAAAAELGARHLPWRADDRWYLALSLAHTGGLAIVIRCLAANKPITRRLEDATIASLVPTQLAHLLADPAFRPPPHLRAVLLGGAAAPPALIEAALARGIPVLPTYGMTETFGQIATARTPGGPLVLLPDVRVTAAPDRPLAIASPTLATAYLEPDGTLAPITSPFATRDLGALGPDGTLAIHGRTDDVIISGGENIHPTTVEAAVAPTVAAAIAFGVPDAIWGEAVAIAIVPSDLPLDAAIAAWHAALPPHARPRRLAVVAALPLLASGKVDRRAARALATRPIEYARS